jgi:hypothetical protein
MGVTEAVSPMSGDDASMWSRILPSTASTESEETFFAGAPPKETVPLLLKLELVELCKDI